MKEEGLEWSGPNYVNWKKGRSLSAFPGVVRDCHETFPRLHETVDIAGIIKAGTPWTDPTFTRF
jgi:hypothetical protein